MPFSTTNVPPTLDSRITIEFAGQLLLNAAYDDTANSTSCEIGVNRFSELHNLQVTLVVQKPDRPPTLIPLLRGPLVENFLIRQDPDPGVGDFKVFAPTPDPFIRTAAANNDDLDYRWALNMQSLLHPNIKRTFGAEPIIRLNTGVLYAPNITDQSLNPTLFRYGSMDIPLYKVAADLAASIVLPAQNSLFLQWSDLGRERHMYLPRDGDDPRTKYTVSFINDPGNFDPMPHPELAFYYRVLADTRGPIPGNERWELRYGHGIRTDEIPCLPVILNP
jgi:hypothetical protein